MTHSRNRYFDVQPGAYVQVADRILQIDRLLSLQHVLVKDPRTGEIERLLVQNLAPVANDHATSAPPAESKDLATYRSEEWNEAERRFGIIRELLSDPDCTRDKVVRTAKSAGVNAATLYRWIRSYRDHGHVAALLPSPRGPRPGKTLLEKEREEILRSVIDEVYLKNNRPTPTDIIKEVERRCRALKVDPPHANTVRRRLEVIPLAFSLRKRGRSDEAAKRLAPVRGHFPGADFPLAVVQIDHTLADLIIVDEQTRRSIGRPWVTLAICVWSRMVVGWYLSLDPPSYVVAGSCIANAILPKEKALLDLDLPGTWPVWGQMARLHADNAKEFRGEMLRRACANNAIDLQLRPVKRPNYGGHIERLMGNVAMELRTLPGATHRSPTERKGYNAEGKAVLTLHEAEQHLVDWIVNVYHQRKHSVLGTTPLKSWELGIAGDGSLKGRGLPPRPADLLRIRIDFLPFVERTVQTYGLQIETINYYSNVLDRWIRATDPDAPKQARTFVVRYDPRNMSTVYFFDPESSEYLEVPYRDMTHPAVSLWEIREAKRDLSKSNSSGDESEIFAAIERARQRVDSAIVKTKKARRAAERRRTGQSKSVPAAQMASASPPATKQPMPSFDDIFSDATVTAFREP